METIVEENCDKMSALIVSGNYIIQDYDDQLFRSTTPEEKLHITVQHWIGSDNDRKQDVDNLYNKLVCHYSGIEYNSEAVFLQHYTHGEIIELLCDYAPNLSGFNSLDEESQSQQIRQSIVIAALAKNKGLLIKLDGMYDDWVNHITESKFEDVNLEVQSAVNKMLKVIGGNICLALSMMVKWRPNFFEDALRMCNVINLSNNGQSIIVNNSSIDSNACNIKGIFYCSGKDSDMYKIDSLFNDHLSKFELLIVISCEDVYDLLHFMHRTVVTEVINFPSLGRRIKWYCNVIKSNNFLPFRYSDDYPTVSLSELIQQKMLHVDDHILNLFNRYEKLLAHRWLWHDSLISAFMSSMHARYRLISSPRLLLSIYLDGISMYLLEHEHHIIEAEQLLINHPLINKCGGEGPDLYLNDLPHSFKTLMFHVEYHDEPFEIEPHLQMNMLDREIVTLGDFDEMFDNDDLRIVKYNWSFDQKTFHNMEGYELINVFFCSHGNRRYEYITVQVLEFKYRGSFVIQYVNPRSPSRMRYLTKDVVQSCETIHALTLEHCFAGYSLLDFDFPTHDYKYFPNIFFARHTNDRSIFGLDIESSVCSFSNRQRLLSLFSSANIFEVRDVHVRATHEPIAKHNQWYGLLLNATFSNCDLFGWVPSIVNCVPAYYFDILRYLRRHLLTEAGDIVYYERSRVEISFGDTLKHTLFPSPSTNHVWNCRIGHMLNEAFIKAANSSNKTLHRFKNHDNRC